MQVRGTGAQYLDRFFASQDRVSLEPDARIQAHERRGVPDSVLYPFLGQIFQLRAEWSTAPTELEVTAGAVSPQALISTMRAE